MANSNDLLQLLQEMRSIESRIHSFERANRKKTKFHPNFERSGINFLHYLALRQSNLKELQFRLASFGLSSLGRSESNVLNTIEQVLERISDSLRAHGKLKKKKPRSIPSKAITWDEAEKILHRNTQTLFGPRPQSRHVYIMVTAPSLPEFSASWVKKVLQSGANLIRINCAHDAPADWELMIVTTRQVSSEMKTSCKIMMDLPGPKIRTASASHKGISPGDQLFLVGRQARAKNEIECSLPEVLSFLKLGDRVLFDDGTFEAVVKEMGKNKKRITLEITRAPPSGAKIKKAKGINLPDSHLKISEVTDDDLLALRFAGVNADLLGLSFVQSPRAIQKIRAELKKHTNKSPGIVLKIETKAGFAALPHLLMEAMKDYPCGVMIARGDLGVEVGFERMVEVQEEILWLCESAHVPVIWATQVLENLAKTGLPSRSEVTDAASAVRAECVMLNKGPFIDKTVHTLSDILTRMEFHTYKKRNIYRKLNVVGELEF